MTKTLTIKLWQLVAGAALMVALGAGVVVRYPHLAKAGQGTTPDFASLSDLYQSLQDKYDGTLDPAKILEGAKAGLVQAAGDPYTTYLTGQESKDLNDSLNGTVSGIGAEIGIKNSKLTVIAPVDGSPAAKAGIKTGDVIASVDGVDTSTLTLDESVAKIRGAKGTSVKLVVVRGSESPMSLTITRDVVTVPSVKTEVKSGGIGYIQISQFNSDTGNLVDQAATKFKQQGIGKIVLDLRNDPGGYLDQAEQVASQFLPQGQTIVSTRKGSTILDTAHSNGGQLNGAKIEVLINSGSASASEILAGALQDNHRAEILGETSFGKGSVQEIEKLGGGAELKVTVAHWYTPGGRNITKEGIKPDVVVTLTTADSNAGRDPQLDAALARLAH